MLNRIPGKPWRTPLRPDRSGAPALLSRRGSGLILPIAPALVRKSAPQGLPPGPTVDRLGPRNGDKGDITVTNSGKTWTIDNNVVTYAQMQDVSATSRILGRKTAGAGDPEECTLSDILDFIGSAAQGDILYRGASGWARLGAGTSGQVLQTGGAGANPSWVTQSGGAFTAVKKTADESVTSSTTMQNDDHLSFSLAASTKYAGRIVLFVNAVSDVNNNFKCQITGPASPTLVRIAIRDERGNGVAAMVPTVLTAFSTSQAVGNSVNATTDCAVFIDFLVQNGANAGTFQLQWAQVTSSATATKVYAGSYLEWTSF